MDMEKYCKGYWVVEWWAETHEPKYKYFVTGHFRDEPDKEFMWKIPNIDYQYEMEHANKLTINEFMGCLKNGFVY